MKVFILVMALIVSVISVSSAWIYLGKQVNPSHETKKTNEINYLTMECVAQMGNQMFHIATGLAYAWDNDLQPHFPDLNNSHDNLSYNRDHIFFRVDSTTPPIPLTHYNVSQLNYVELPGNLANVNFTGGFFSWKFFHHHYKKILEVFAPSQEILDKLHTKYADLLSLDNTVAIHVRTFSKILHESGCHFVGMNYFEEAMRKYPANANYVVFSDRINWTKEKFSQAFPDKNFIFIEGNDHIEDFFLMSMMKHQIISKSTFSWWAAYLNKNPQKVVSVPILKTSSSWIPLWIKEPIQYVISSIKGVPFWSDQDYYLSNWELISYNVDPFPEDIYAFGDVSKSVYLKDQ